LLISRWNDRRAKRMRNSLGPDIGSLRPLVAATSSPTKRISLPTTVWRESSAGRRWTSASYGRLRQLHERQGRGKSDRRMADVFKRSTCRGLLDGPERVRQARQSIAGPAAELCRSPGARLRLARPLASVSPSGHYPSAAPANVHTIAQGGQALGRHGPTGFLQQPPKAPRLARQRAVPMAALRWISVL